MYTNFYAFTLMRLTTVKYITQLNWSSLYFCEKQINPETCTFCIAGLPLKWWSFQITTNYLYKRRQFYKIQQEEGIGLCKWKVKLVKVCFWILILTSGTTPSPRCGPGTRRWSSGRRSRGSPGSSSSLS